MNRREFFRRSAPFAAIAVVAPVALPAIKKAIEGPVEISGDHLAVTNCHFPAGVLVTNGQYCTFLNCTIHAPASGVGIQIT